MKQLQTENADLESQLQNANAAMKQMKIQAESNEEELDQTTSSYKKLYAQFGQL